MIGKTTLHYKILAKLGEGGMPSFREKYNKLVPQAAGVVSKAEDTKLKRILREASKKQFDCVPSEFRHSMELR